MRKNIGVVLLLGILAGVSLSCVGTEERRQPLKELPPPRIQALQPSAALAGTGFLVQPSGESAMVVNGSDFTNTSRICFNGKPHPTAFGSSTVLTAIVPSELHSRPGTLEVTVENPDGKRSNAVLFQVLPASGVAPRISRLLPGSCVTGQAFNPQSNGESALAVEGTDFVPGATIYFGATALATAFGGPGGLTAIVPAALLKRPRRVQVHVRNPDGKASQSVPFTVTGRSK